MPGLPAELWDRDFVKGFFGENLQLFYDPRRWRVALNKLTGIQIQLLSFRPPEFDVLIRASMTPGEGERTFHFYEGIVVGEVPTKGERVYGKSEIRGDEFYFIDAYTSRRYLKNLLEAWCRGERLDSIGFVGSFLGLKGGAEIEINRLEQLSGPGEEPTTNYLYRCGGLARSTEGEKEFDIIVKRFLPREPADRGNREYSMMKILPASIVPQVHGGLVNHALAVNGEPQMLVIFTGFVDGVEVGKEMWRGMEEIARAGKNDVAREGSLGRLRGITEEVVDKVIFPFHKSSFEAWYSPGRTLGVGDRFHRWYFGELRENLATVKDAGLITGDEERELWMTFAAAWDRILTNVKATEVHGDLMWRQILKTKSGGLVILDLDDHVMGHAGKDIADLCAANRFIAEDLPCQDKNLVRDAAESLGRFIVEKYIQNAEAVGAEWAEMLEETVLIYLAHRHLHDAAYFTPAWLGATDERQGHKYKRYVDLSMSLFRESVGRLKALLVAGG